MNIFIKGQILYNYTKHNLIPFVEDDHISSKHPLKVLNTKIGKISTVNCYDINYPMFINSLSKNHLDILIVSSWDYQVLPNFNLKRQELRL